MVDQYLVAVALLAPLAAVAAVVVTVQLVAVVATLVAVITVPPHLDVAVATATGMATTDTASAT